MSYRLVGAILIIFSCGGFGFFVAASHKREVQSIRGLLHALKLMECELSYRLTPLPELCEIVGKAAKGQVGTIFLRLGEELRMQLSPDVVSCMNAVLADLVLPCRLRSLLVNLGNTLGRFDLQGQLSGLAAVKADCQRELDELTNNQELRLRSYQTLGLCAGAALAILFI